MALRKGLLRPGRAIVGIGVDAETGDMIVRSGDKIDRTRIPGLKKLLDSTED